MASRLPLVSHRTIPRFLRLTLAVARQLQHSPGLVGYSLLAQPIAKTFWTLSAWQDQHAPTTFTRARPHLQVMKDLRPHMMSTSRFIRWAVLGSSLPVNWGRRLRAAQRGAGADMNAPTHVASRWVVRTLQAAMMTQILLGLHASSRPSWAGVCPCRSGPSTPSSALGSRWP